MTVDDPRACVALYMKLTHCTDIAASPAYSILYCNLLCSSWNMGPVGSAGSCCCFHCSCLGTSPSGLPAEKNLGVTAVHIQHTARAHHASALAMRAHTLWKAEAETVVSPGARPCADTCRAKSRSLMGTLSPYRVSAAAENWKERRC